MTDEHDVQHDVQHDVETDVETDVESGEDGIEADDTEEPAADRR